MKFIQSLWMLFICILGFTNCGKSLSESLSDYIQRLEKALPQENRSWSYKRAKNQPETQEFMKILQEMCLNTDIELEIECRTIPFCRQNQSMEECKIRYEKCMSQDKKLFCQELDKEREYEPVLTPGPDGVIECGTVDGDNSLKSLLDELKTKRTSLLGREISNICEDPYCRNCTPLLAPR